MKPFIVLLLMAIFALGCSDRTSTTFQSEFTNNSGHAITITPYLSGAVLTDYIITLAPSEKKTVYVNDQRGLSNEGFTYGNGIGADSFIVEYDNTYPMAHYTYGIVTGNPKSYDYANARNIRNYNSYTLIKEDPKKRRRILRYLFTFTVQDYLDAQ